MKKLTRKDFLKLSGMSLGAVSLAMLTGCGSSSSSSSTSSSESESSSTESSSSEAATVDTQGSAVAEDTDYEGTVSLVYGIVGSDFGGLNPYGTSSTINGYFRRNIFESLCVRDGYGGDPVPYLAKSVEKIAERTYEVEIYDYIYDSAGNHITADDIVFSYEYARDCGTVTKMYYMESIAATGDYTVEIVTSSEDLGVYENLLSAVYIVSRDAYEGSGDSMATNPIGTGPYVMEDYVNGSHMLLTKRDDYWQTDESLTWSYYIAKVDQIKYQLIADSASIAIALETGTIDIIMSLSGSDVDYFAEEDSTAKDGYNVVASVNKLIPGLFFNMDTGSIFEDNLELRQAILYAINRTDLITACLDNKGKECYAFASEIYGDYLEKWMDEEYYPYDIEKAQSLLEEASFDQTSDIRILCQSSDPFKSAAELIGAYLYSLGLTYEIVAVDDTLYNEYKYDSTKWDLKIDQCQSPDILPNIWNYCFNWANYDNYGTSFIHDEYFQELLNLIATEEGHTDENLDACHRYMTDNAWVIGLWDAYDYCIGKDTVNLSVLDGTPYPASFTVTSDFEPII